MDAFITTYSKDYRWPYVRAMSVRAEAPYLTTLPHRERQKLTVPGCEREQDQPKVLGPDKFGKTWCKLGPSPPLLAPVVYYSEQSPAQRDTARFDQPNAYLKQLYDKYPYLYKIIQASPPDELIRRIKNARNISTYQSDYDHMGDGISKEYNDLIAHGFDSVDPCAKQKLAEGQSGPTRYIRPKVMSKSLDYRELKRLREAKESQEQNSSSSGIIKPGISEYMDSISKTGATIIREKLLHKQKKK